MRYRILMVSAVVATMVAGLETQSARESDATLVPLIGTWNTAVEDGHTVFTMDGLTASAGPQRPAIASMFGADAETFLAAARAPGVFPIAAAREVADLRSGRLTVEFKLLAGELDRSAGIVFNLQPNGSYHYARYNTKDGNVAVWKFEDGARAVLAHGELHEQLPLGVWHRLTVTIAGASVTAVANDRFRVQHTIDRPVTGRVGVWAKTDVKTAFRRFGIVR